MSNFEIQDNYEQIDISEEIQFYFEIKLKFSNIAPQNISIVLRNKHLKKDLQKIVLVDKNVIKFSELRTNLIKIEDLNEIYELFWEISEG